MRRPRPDLVGCTTKKCSYVSFFGVLSHLMRCRYCCAAFRDRKSESFVWFHIRLVLVAYGFADPLAVIQQPLKGQLLRSTGWEET